MLATLQRKTKTGIDKDTSLEPGRQEVQQ